MAQPALERFTRRGLAMKLEVTEGTDSVPTPALDGIMLLDGTSGTEFDKVERPVDRPFFTGNPFGVANRRAFVEGDWELMPPPTPGGPTTSDIYGDVLLRTGGMTAVKDAINKTTRYNPVSQAIPSASAYFWHVDNLKKIIASRTQLSGIRIAIGEHAKCRVRVQGRYTDVMTEVLPNIVLPTVEPVIATFENSTTHIAFNGGPDLLVWAKELSIDLGSDLQTKEYTSLQTTAISGRQPTWTLRIARTDLADFNPWEVRDASEIFEARIRTLNTLPTGLYTEIGIRGQIESISETDIDGDLGWELSGPCIASNSGGDEMYIEVGDTTP